MNAHLVEISRHVSPGAHAIFDLDGAGWHSSRDFVVPPNITLPTLPPQSPELNPVDNAWQFPCQNRLANRVFDSYDAIVDICCGAWNAPLATRERVASVTLRSWAQVSGCPRYEAGRSRQSSMSCRASPIRAINRGSAPLRV